MPASDPKAYAAKHYQANKETYLASTRALPS